MIRNREHMRSIVNFDNLTFGNISPMDLDAFMEFNNKLYIFIETKYLDAQMPFGQQLALERLCDMCYDTGKQSFVFLTSHADHDEIDLGNSVVTKYRWQKQWHIPKSKTTLHDAVLKIKDKYL